MILAGERYYKIYRITLTLIGLWPYRVSTVSRIQTACYFAMYFSIVFFQLMKCITSTYNLMFIIKYLSYFLPTVIYTINYNSFYFNAKTIKQALEHIRLDWNTLTDSSEIEILTRYTYTAYILSLIMYVLISLGIACFLLLECSPVILDAIAPMNVSRPHATEVLYEFFIDEEQYFFFYVTYEVLALTIGVGTMVATGTLLLAIGSHSCAEFKIASDLIHNIMTDRTFHIPASQRTYFMYQNICRAVHIHRRTMKFLSDLLNAFHVWYFFIILIGVASLSCNLFRFLDTITQLNDIYELFRCFAIFTGHIVCMFAGNLAGQAIIDYSTEILNAAYNTLWYVAPLPIQKMLLFIQKSVRGQKLTVGGVFVASLEGFFTLVTSAVSYFTVMYTMTKH